MRLYLTSFHKLNNEYLEDYKSNIDTMQPKSNNFMEKGKFSKLKLSKKSK